ncbi:PDR/VanB family oxidoreductase [Prescottella equi]|uniref:PDR/VanB family oxidoreductase n=1 Tax=Rhodococcus hoagii TaxID=43767 RepID=UPI002741F362|nr:PDR/VanB family oxidoreductase [Prescottella equi]MDP8015156.1 PDR/VanB family oxidoreductase [Prescottella equi]
MSTVVSVLLVREQRLEADGVVSLVLEDPQRAELPEWSPGAHIEIVLPSGTVRQYSLCGDPADRRSYRIAVLRRADGRGGSAEVHDTLRVGDLIGVRPPRNHFELIAAQHYLLVAGGIGVTPILTMAEELTRTGASWTMVYIGRSSASMAFQDRVTSLGGRVDILPRDVAARPDLAAYVSQAPAGTAVYCCGPEGLLDATRAATATGLGEDAFHSERFGAAPGAGAAAGSDDDGAFEIELQRSGQVLTVPADRSILAVVREVDPTVAYSCEDGFCGSCEMKVLAGVPDHRDSVLTKAERESNTTMMICVGRAKSNRLVFDA